MLFLPLRIGPFFFHHFSHTSNYLFYFLSLFLLLFPFFSLHFSSFLIFFLFSCLGALKADPTNALHALWYAKLLRKKGQLKQAEIMYQVAMRSSTTTASVSVNTTSNTDNTNNSNRTNCNDLSNISDIKNYGLVKINNSIEASAICNYATFIYKQKKSHIQALELFENGLNKYIGHKGLIKNYLFLLKENPFLVPEKILFEKIEKMQLKKNKKKFSQEI